MERKDLTFVDLNDGTSIWTEIQGKTDIYSVRVFLNERGDFVYEKSSCDCRFGSWFGHTKKNREMKKICVHLSDLLRLIGKEDKSLAEVSESPKNTIAEDSLTKLWNNEYDKRWNNE